MDLVALRRRLTDTVERIPILGRLLSEFVRIEFIDRCMLIAAQALLALVPMLIVLAAFFPRLTAGALDQLTAAAGLGKTGSDNVSGQLDSAQVRAQTGVVGIVVTLFSATSFARALERMLERVWDQPHIGGLAGTRRCFLWLIGWLVGLQLLAAARALLGGGFVADVLGIGVHAVAMCAIWWLTAWLLLFGRVGWWQLALGAVLAGALTVLYSHAAALLMPPYVAASTRQFGTLGLILAVSTWLIGLAAVVVGSALVGRVVTEDPSVRRLMGTLRERLAGRAARPAGGSPRRRPAGRA
ncbi:YhjD/YihY/BrkB family envelope integrity protein [Nocardioides sp. CER19]|uniref:YhjD/YihY/BrkB family envelope integrity protein n=1 Tax=Nocardioides sp. CER19 TaxID=3038538 RepID=UPI0024476BF9|nr:YhjD/YihY/BrkB family envelope integrity protein [Nocardioides sp. CER19]MDH2416012.1 YhjD/YihY/BrkB family envelope integrity protein [Nocardioides sp. CER19]